MVPLATARTAGEGPEDGGSPRVLSAALVGAGAVAKQHLACLAELDCARVVAVCDLSRAVAEAAAERLGVPAFFTDHRAMLAELSPDVVHVTTPPDSHFEIAMDALVAGAHAIVEKPIVARAGDLELLLAEAEKRDRVVIENYNYVFNPQARKMRRLIESGELGQLTHVDVDLAVDILGDGSPFADPNRAVADFLPHLA